MIKVNLLSEGRKPVTRAPRVEVGTAREWGQIALLSLLVLGLLVVGGRWWMLRAEIRDNAAEIAGLEEEVERLRPIIEQVEAFEAQKAELEHRIEIISGLKAAQTAPVNIMAQVSRALPELVWLLELEVGGDTVQITGRAFNTNAVATFVEGLDRVPEFQEPMVKDVRKERVGNRDVYRFSLSFPFTARTEGQEAAP